jgi:hypothetical protein
MSDFAWGLVLLGAYMVLVIMARWIYIARTNVIWTRAQAEAITGRLSLQSGSSPSANGKARVMPLALRRLLKKIKAQNPKSRLSGIVGWNGSHQIAQWVLMHEAERMSLSALDHAQLVARLERALGQLDELPLPRREAWEFKIRTLLADEDEADKRMDDAYYRAYLDEVLGEIYEASNGNAIQLSGLYNRATWIILVSLLPLAVLAGFGFGMLLVAGAIGGLVSRMQRLVFSTRIPVTYGSSWGPLFCAPVLGALAAWAGLALISLLQTANVLQLTALQTSLDSLRAPSAAVLGTAILLGASERFLLRLEKQAEAVIDPDHVGPADQATPAHTSAGGPRVRLISTAAAKAAPAEANGEAAKAAQPKPTAKLRRRAVMAKRRRRAVMLPEKEDGPAGLTRS